MKYNVASGFECKRHTMLEKNMKSMKKLMGPQFSKHIDIESFPGKSLEWCVTYPIKLQKT